jgi:fucose 4-O-acetylase-like acetyltransferase
MDRILDVSETAPKKNAVAGGTGMIERPEMGAIHWLKAVAILAVVTAHADPDPWLAGKTSGQLIPPTSLLFHVPVFVFVSGFLYWSPVPISASDVFRRIVRLLGPYLVASIVTIASGLFPRGDDMSILFQLLTGSAQGIYFYVFIMTILTPSIWILSRCAPLAVSAILFAVVAYFLAALFFPNLLPIQGWFWGPRNPVYMAHFFLAGWIAREYRDHIRSFYEDHTTLARLAAGTAVFTCLVIVSPEFSLAAHRLWRTVYSFAIIALVTILTYKRSAPFAIRFLSTSTFTTYLYHRIPQKIVSAYTVAFPSVVSVACLIFISIASTVLLVVVGKRLFRNQSKFVIGT